MSLKQRTFSAGRWTATSALVRSGLQILQTVVLARLLAPSDFGLMAITASMIAILNLFTDLGLSRAIIHYENISNNAMTSLYWLNLFTGATLSLLFALAAPLCGSIFALDGLTSVLLAISPLFMLSAVGQQFSALAEKEFRFAALALNEIGSVFIGITVAVFIALRGGGVYALVASALATTAANSALALWRLSNGHRPRLHFSLKETAPYLHFGTYLVGEGIANTLIRQADVFAAGLVVRPGSLGLFSLPRDLSIRIGMVVNPIITRVGFPVMSRLQNDSTALKSVYLHTLRMTASVNFPVYAALALFADEVVALLYGAQWKEAATYLRILSVWGLIRSTGNPTGNLLHAVGAVKRAFLWNVALLLLVPLLYWISVRGWGLSGLAATLVVLQTMLVIPSWYFLVRPYCGATVDDYLRQLYIPLGLALIASLAAWLTTKNVPHGTLRLTLGGVVGSLVYLALSWILNRQWFVAMWTLLRLPSRSSTPR